MNQHLILLPVFALIILTFGMGIWLGKLRVLAVKQGHLNPRYFELNRGAKLPDDVAKVSNNYDNLLALPMLFYVLILFLLVTNQIGVTQIILAWLFVITRYAHSYIHTMNNNVRHRMKVFLLSVVVLIIMWSLFILRTLFA